jgi:hypothetical protein
MPQQNARDCQSPLLLRGIIKLRFLVSQLHDSSGRAKRSHAAICDVGGVLRRDRIMLGLEPERDRRQARLEVCPATPRKPTPSGRDSSRWYVRCVRLQIVWGVTVARPSGPKRDADRRRTTSSCRTASRSCSNGCKTSIMRAILPARCDKACRTTRASSASKSSASAQHTVDIDDPSCFPFGHRESGLGVPLAEYQVL